MVAISVNRSALSRLRFVLFNDPDLLQDDALILLAHALSGPRVAADLLTFNSERYFFADIVQRIYTDDGHGNGHVTLAGLKSARMLMNAMSGASSIDWTAYATASTIPVLSASRGDLIAKYDSLMDQTEANFHRPIREIDVHQVQSQIVEMRSAPVQRIRFLVLTEEMSAFTAAQAQSERYLGERDGAMVGIALELFRRKNGKYPSSLTELTPQLLPSIPADRITGAPIKFRLIDGKPVVYSVGADRIDDGGRPPNSGKAEGRYRNDSTAIWGVDPASAPRGDWRLFAPPTSTDD